jgi:hypothetical protein
MGSRCFGDTRDLFKFDLVRHIMKSLPDLDGFTFVPMLTGTGGHGKNAAKKDLMRAYHSGKAGSQNIQLRDHLERLQKIDTNLEYINGVSTYFDKEMILIDIPARQQFTNHDRTTYFRSVFGKFPKNSLIFIDPDTGFRDGSADSRHLLYSEIQMACKRMDNGSVLMVYHHFPRGKQGNFITGTCASLEKCTGVNPSVITDNEIVFFILAKNQNLADRLKNSLECYADTYPALECVTCA